MTRPQDITPFRFRAVSDKLLITNEIGDYGLFDTEVLDRFFNNSLSDIEQQKFQQLSILIEPGAEWRLASIMRRIRDRSRDDSVRLSYLIIVPTLRCDLACSYCQVSRAPLDSTGFDWTSEQLTQFERFLDQLDGTHLKLEFQGGEPTLRPDLLEQIIQICEHRFQSVDFVICSNLTRLNSKIEEIISRDNVTVSRQSSCRL